MGQNSWNPRVLGPDPALHSPSTENSRDGVPKGSLLRSLSRLPNSLFKPQPQHNHRLEMLRGCCKLKQLVTVPKKHYALGTPIHLSLPLTHTPVPMAVGRKALEPFQPALCPWSTPHTSVFPCPQLPLASAGVKQALISGPQHCDVIFGITRTIMPV